jgi:hypothetical protein
MKTFGLEESKSLGTWLPLLFLTACLGSEGSLMEVPRSDCEALRDHLIELRIAAGAGASEPSERVAAELERHRQTLRTVYGDSYLTDCQLKTSPEVIACALEAPDRTALADCGDLRGTR